MPKLRVALSFESSLLSTFLKGSSLAALPLRTKDVDIPYFVQNFLLALLAYGIGSHTSYPYIHKLLLHKVLQAYTLIECLEREVFDERYAVYLYIIDLCTELDGLGFLASDDGTYDAVTDFCFKHFFLVKHLSDDGKTLMIILGNRRKSTMDPIPLTEELFKKLPVFLSLPLFSCSRTDRIGNVAWRVRFCTFLKGSSLAALSLRTKDVGYRLMPNICLAIRGFPPLKGVSCP